ncbi:MAG: iron-sulfur cluster assembly accessory protein, partial [Gammaproteobacteria bacterium]|nr:iron-sulfur cluster assembly accessory protein [Gammaproteobacteria bacterium]
MGKIDMAQDSETMSDATFGSELGSMELIVTPAAGRKIAELMAETDIDVEAVRIFVSGGGCGGMSYGMTFAEERAPLDSMYTGDRFNLYVDPIALNYLKGAEIDFANDGINATFVFNNVFQIVGGSGACGG